MYITSLSLTNWRNFRHIEAIELPAPQLLVAVAPNATGKTNFLESIILLLRGKSWRSSLEECVCWGQPDCSVRGTIRHGDVSSNLALSFQYAPRRLRIEEDGVPVSPITFYSRYPLVLFLPEDTFLFNRGPAQRRNFFNQILAGSATYVSTLVQYHRTVRARNEALKTARTPEAIQAWTDVLINFAIPLWQQRQLLIDFLSTHLSVTYAQLMGEDIPFVIRLLPGMPAAEKEISSAVYQAVLAAAWPYEQRYNYTLYGPHRDDLEITVVGRGVDVALSRGQLRGLVLALKIAAWKFIQQVTGEEPIILLDDVLSELDEAHQTSLLTHLPSTQILLTCTAVPASLQKQDVHFLDLRALLHVSPALQPIRAR